MSAVSEAVVLPRARPAAPVRQAAHGMGIGQSVATALEALNANKLRALLTNDIQLCAADRTTSLARLWLEDVAQPGQIL